jgi:hypothetical protein
MLESLKINLENRMDADTFLSHRQKIVDEAIEQQDISTLKAISQIDKENLLLLNSEKNKLAKKLEKLSKIKNYLD